MVPGASATARAETIGAASLTLAPQDLREIDEVAAKVQGERYPEQLERMTGR